MRLRSGEVSVNHCKKDKSSGSEVPGAGLLLLGRKGVFRCLPPDFTEGPPNETGGLGDFISKICIFNSLRPLAGMRRRTPIPDNFTGRQSRKRAQSWPDIRPSGVIPCAVRSPSIPYHCVFLRTSVTLPKPSKIGIKLPTKSRSQAAILPCKQLISHVFLGTRRRLA